MARVQRTHEENRRHWEAESRRVVQEMADDPEGPFKEYDAAIRSLRSQAGKMSHREAKTRMRDLGREHEVVLPEAYLELQSRLTTEEDFHRRRWRELRSGSFRMAG